MQLRLTAAMHIFDGLLEPEVCAATAVVSVGAVGYSLHRLKDSLVDKTVPMTGMMASLVFAGQMVNFPLVGLPVSGHLMGGVLAAAVLGPWAGCIAITLVLIVQCALFADGGLLALGANVLHMAVVGSLGGYAVYAAIRRLLGGGARATVAAAVVASWLTVLAAATLFCLEFFVSCWLAGTLSQLNFGNIFVLMTTFHSLIGVGEALITGCAVSFILAQRPDLLYDPQRETGLVPRLTGVVAGGMVCALAIGAFLAPFASEYADGFEAVAEKAEFADRAAATPALFEDYDQVPVPIADWQGASVSLAGVGGSLAVFLIALILGRTLGRPAAVGEAGHE